MASIHKHGATKADINELRAATKAEIDAANARLEGLTATVISIQKHGATKADLRELETRMIKWLVATAVAVTGVIVAAVGALLMVLPRLIPPR